MPRLQAGDPAPDFSLPDQDGKERSLSGFRGGWVILYFYPKDLTPGCTIEACAFRDAHPKFRRAKVTVLGVSADTVKRHSTFIERFGLPFALLSDGEKKAAKAYGVWTKKRFMGREYMGIARRSFLIGPDGTIRKVYEDVRPAGHAKEVLDDLKTFAEG